MGITPQGVDLGSAYAEVVVDFSNVERAANTAFANMERGLLDKVNRIGVGMQTVGRNVSLMLAPVSAFVTQGVFAFANFDEILTEIEARTGATADEMERVKQVSLEMGKNTQFSASEASQAMLEMLSSGSSLEEAIAGLPHVLSLAAAGSIELGHSADAVTDILAQFQLGMEDSEEVVNALAAASQKSSATIPDLVEAFARVGGMAASFGLSVDDTAAVLAVFAENGIKGARAGGELQSMLKNMSRTTPDVQEAWTELGISLFDAEGNARDFNDVITDLDGALEGMTDEQRIDYIYRLAGAEGALGLQALLASDGIGQMQSNMSEATSASDLAESKMNSFKGVINQVKSSIETLSITVLGPLVEDYLQPLGLELVDLINVLNDWMLANPELASQLGLVLGLLAILGPTIFGVGTAITLLGSAAGIASIAVVAIAGALGALWIAYEQNFMGFGDAVDEVAADLLPTLQSIADWFGNVADAIRNEDWDRLGDLIKDGFSAAWDAIGDLGESALEAFSDIDWQKVWDDANQMSIDFTKWRDETITQPLKDAIADIDWGKLWNDANRASQENSQWQQENLINPFSDWLKEELFGDIEIPEGPLKDFWDDVVNFLWDESGTSTVQWGEMLADGLKDVNWDDFSEDISNLWDDFLGLFNDEANSNEADWESLLFGDLADVDWSAVGEDISNLWDDFLDLIDIEFDSADINWKKFLFGGLSDVDFSSVQDEVSGWFSGDETGQGGTLLSFLQDTESTLGNIEVPAMPTEDQIKELQNLKDWFDLNSPIISSKLEDMELAANDFITVMKNIWTDLQSGWIAYENGTTRILAQSEANARKNADSFDAMGTRINSALNEASNPMRMFGSAVAQAMGVASNAVNELINQFGTLASRINSVSSQQLSINVPSMSGIPRFAEGGMYQANQPRIVGDGGVPELDVPRQSGMIVGGDQLATALKVLSNGGFNAPMAAPAGAGGGGNGGTTVNGDVNISIPPNAIHEGASAEDVAAAVSRVFENKMRFNGGGTASV